MSTKTLHISDDLSLPLDIVTMRTATYGDSGAGKTTFARLLAEKVHDARQRFCAIDLKNDWYGLKSSADGASAGIPVVVFGGPRGDVRLIDDAAAARALAETVASIEQSVVLDLDAMSRAKQERFLTAFLDALYEANRRPLLLFCDEADRYAPQKPMSQDAIMCLSSSEDIARRGRKRGIGSFWLTQRTAVLNKNVSEFANLTVVFRTPGEKDLKELEDRVGRVTSKDVVKEVMRLAPGLADGEAFFLSAHPKLRKFMPDPVRPIQLPLPWTFDSSATPGVGQRRREPKVLASADLAAIESRMAAQVEQAKAEDPKHLRAELARVKGELAKAQAAKPAPLAADDPAIDRRVKAAVTAAIRARDDDWETTFHVRFDSLKANVVSAVNLAVEPKIKPPPIDWVRIGEARLAAIPEPAPMIPQRAALIAPTGGFMPKPPRIIPPPRPRADTNGDGGAGGITPRQQRMLNAAATLTTLGVEVSRDSVCGWVGVHPRGGSVGEELKALVDAGLITNDRGAIAVTDAGMAVAEQLDASRAVEQAKAGLSPRQTRIFDLIVAAYPGETTREAIAEQMQIHPRGGSFGEDLGRLVGRGLVEGSRGTYRARDFLFAGANQ